MYSDINLLIKYVGFLGGADFGHKKDIIEICTCAIKNKMLFLRPKNQNDGEQGTERTI